MKITINSLPSKLQTQVRLQAQSLREGKLEQSLPAALDTLDEVAAYQPGSRTSRLAEIAKKVGREGDSTLAELGGVELLEQLSAVGQAAGPALEMLVGPVAAVVAVTLDALEKAAPGDDLIVTLAQTGLDAINAVKDSQNPMAGGLAGEAFLIGIAEHRDLNETAGEVCDFLQEEMPATMVQPAREAYLSVLSDLVQQPQASKSSMLAGAGHAAFHAIPGQEKALLPLVTSFVEELGSVENPFSAGLAQEASDFVESYAKKKETEEKAVILVDALFSTLDGKSEATSVEGATKLGQDWVKTLSGLELPEADRLQMAEAYMNTLAEEIGSPALEFAKGWMERLAEDDAATKFAVMDSVLSISVPSLNSPLAILDMAKKVAVDKPEQRNSALGALIGLLGEELGREDLGEVAGEAYSAESLIKKEETMLELTQQLSKSP